MELHAQLVLPPAAEDQVGVGVHQTGGDQVALGVNDLSAGGGGGRAGAHRVDDPVLHQDPGVLQNLDLALLGALLGGLALGGGQHTDVLYQNVSHHENLLLTISLAVLQFWTIFDKKKGPENGPLFGVLPYAATITCSGPS